MNRRDFLKLLGISGVCGIAPFETMAFFAASLPALPIPGLLKADSDGLIRLRMQEGQSQWLSKPTQTWGFNGAVLGPALWLQQGQKVLIEVENALGEETSVHWHGLKVPGIVDGGPQSPIAPGEAWKPELVIDQPAATCWFHPHPHAKTGRHMAMGLGGLVLINDEESQRLALPKDWGVDDIPVILQDRRLNASGQIDYTMDVVSAVVGWFGELMLTNASLYPEHAAPRGWLRMRLLNACNARSLRLAASDGRPLYVIASDGGFLSEPVELSELPIFVGERFEVLVDLSDGKPFDLLTLPVMQMGMHFPPFDKPLPVLRIQPTEHKGRMTTMPDQLVALPPLPKRDGLPTRTLTLAMDPWLDREGMRQLTQRYGGAMPMGMHSAMTMPTASQSMNHDSMNMGASPHSSEAFDLWHGNSINGQAFAMDKPMFDVEKGQYERWVISGVGDTMLHPFHIHGTQFRILSENGIPPQAHRSGFKDTVRVEGGESEVLVRFDHPAPKEHAFMAHCHLLEHEDTGMMMSFTVTG